MHLDIAAVELDLAADIPFLGRSALTGKARFRVR